ncbi:MAG TPA: hypothetical protein VKU85_17575 [bacterium]|nr:hypothetical protein [bacterium]
MALRINISQGEPHPNGNHAKLSKSANGNPKQAKWHAADAEYRVTLPSAVFQRGKNGEREFVVPKGATSEPFALKSNAPVGRHEYSISATQAGLPGTGNPVVMVDP